MAYNEHLEVVEALEPTVAKLIAEHRERRKHWYFHDFIPWEEGRSFTKEPWEESQASINERARTSLVLNLLTEDNLPYYHATLEKYLPAGSVWREWNGLWTAEEGQHAIAIRSYLLTSRNCDPVELEDDRMATMAVGYAPDWSHPAELFAYTSAQELATRVSHRNTGKITEDETAFELMRNIAADENHHFMFYKGVMQAMLETHPTVALEGILRTFTNFQMPGVGIPGFLRRSIDIAKAGVYNLRVHHDNVIMPLIRQWGIGELKGLDSAASELQEKLMALPGEIIAKAERFEARFGMA
ncbi:MAG TPA: acyl-ACP desaturase [Acidimicrobiia bacterium]|nr:acyl-ACP desaturase [Acidimicrobiia bacterium]